MVTSVGEDDNLLVTLNMSIMQNTTPTWNDTLEDALSDDEIERLENISRYMWMISSPIIFLTGCVGNTLNLVVLWKLRFWNKPVYLFLFILSICDITVLCVGLSKYWIQETFHFDLRTMSDFGCKINLFVIYWSMQLSSWLLVCVIFERVLKTNFPLKYPRFVRTKRCVTLIVFIVVFLAGVDFHFFLTNGLIIQEDGEVECTSLNHAFYEFEEKTFTYIDFAFLSIVPFTLMVIFNIFIYRVIRKSRKWRQKTVKNQKEKSKRMKKFDTNLTRMLVLSSVYFLFSTTPISVYFIVDSYVKLDDLGEARKGVAWTVCYLLQFTNYTANFFIYNMTNAKFKTTIKETFGCKFKR